MDSKTQLNITQLIEGIPHAAMILDDGGRIVHMNRLMEAITGYNRAEVTGIHGELVVRSNTGNNRAQLYNQVLKTGETVSVAGDILNCYRRKIKIQYTVAPLNDLENNRCGLLIIAEDITEASKESTKGVLGAGHIELIGYSPKMQKVFDLLPLMAQTDASVMITGETGTGKDKVAEIIHQKSARARFPFIKVNCGALPPGLLESELFGHVKGAFTGATRNKPGMFELAHRGTLFLTEIGDMPLPLQVKLLSVLDDREFVPVGGENKISVDVRIIAATHRPLREQINRKEFREDLFYRLHVLHIHLPPLREREEDIRYLLDHFLEKFSRNLGKHVVGFAPDTMEMLLKYHYPGNVRELKNIVEYAVNIGKKKKIHKELLPAYLFEPPPEQQKAVQATDTEKTTPASLNSMLRSAELPPAREEKTQETWDDVERKLILETLRDNRGSRAKTAQALGWGRMTLWRKMKRYELI
jgi:PAS domain S-box-containing protein